MEHMTQPVIQGYPPLTVTTNYLNFMYTILLYTMAEILLQNINEVHHLLFEIIKL